MQLRPAAVEDARGIAVVHVRSWQAAYRGLMPQQVLDSLSVAEREANWERILSETARGSRTLVVERIGTIAGWASFGAARDADAIATGELWGIYVHPRSWSLGIGRLLIDAVEEELRADGHDRAYLWVLEGNERASSFYERTGWAPDGGTKIERRPGLTLRERRHVKHLR